jgi:hypothetical protein
MLHWKNLFNAITHYFFKRSQGEIVGFCLLFLFAIAVIDFLTGYKLSFSIFYLAPILLITWSVNRTYGLAFAILSGFLWFLVDIATNPLAADLIYPFWNASVRTGFFLSGVFMLDRLKFTFAEQKKLLAELNDSFDQIKTLNGLLPICAWCKKIRDDQGYWHQVDAYIAKHSELKFTHGICPYCRERLEKEQLAEIAQ